MIEEKDLAPIGKFQKTHALKGELNTLLDVDPEYVTDGNALIVDMDGIYVPFYADSIRGKGTSSFLVKLDGIDSEAEAKPFVNKTIYAMKSELASYADESGEGDVVFLDDLVGYSLTDSDLGKIGAIAEINDDTDNALFIVETPDGERVYVPAADELIEYIDHDAKEVGMRLPEGIIDLNNK